MATPAGKRLTPVPPDKGSFPLDHEGLCKEHMTKFMKCILQKKENDKCRVETKEYMQCRMDKKVFSIDKPVTELRKACQSSKVRVKRGLKTRYDETRIYLENRLISNSGMDKFGHYFHCLCHDCNPFTTTCIVGVE